MRAKETFARADMNSQETKAVDDLAFVVVREWLRTSRVDSPPVP